MNISAGRDASTTRKRVLIITLHFAPEETGNAPYAAGLAQGLSRDFDVDVITAHPHYPQWRFAEGYGQWRRTEQFGSVEVHRLRHFLPTNPTGLTRILSEGTFAARSLTPHVPRPDAIVTMTPALAPVASAFALGRRWKIPVGVVVQDLYSKAFAELGLLGGRLNDRVFAFERSLLKRADGIVSIHEAMARVIERDFEVPADAVTVIPNWTHVDPPRGDRLMRRRELDWDDDVITVVHAGNMGAKQELEALIPVARAIDEQALPIRLVLIGNGGRRAQLEEAARNVRSMTFMDALPSESFMDTLAAADALLLHERAGMKEMCVPSKLTSYFAASRPVIGVTEADSAAAHEIVSSGAGVVVPPQDPAAFIAGLQSLKQRSFDDLGLNGFKYAQQSLNEDVALDRYRAWVQGLLATSLT